MPTASRSAGSGTGPISAWRPSGSTSRTFLTEIGGDNSGWDGAPDGSMIGHVHLRVGDAKDAESWWHEEMKFDTVAHYGGQAVFLSTGGYHHHIGANVWHSSGAGKRDLDRTGLAGWR